ncbi:MAG: D-alanyl-D-alanine carboxypeptidase family protein [Mycobacterium leprae]
MKVVANPADIGVLVNKVYMLPEGYTPGPLVEPNVPFIFSGHDEKREMRQDAAQALEVMFAAAAKDGIKLAGVSGYRSHTTQTGLYNVYLKQYGQAWVDQYSAVPGHSEHETGLAMDISGIDGKCAADDCFANTPEANWLAANASKYGFILRYPEGKEAITGYHYEAWHYRYVGNPMASAIAAKNETLEEYYGAKGQ